MLDFDNCEIANAENRAAAIASERFVPEDLDQKADFDFHHGDTEAGERSLQRALDKLEHRRTKIIPGGYRVSFFDRARPLYERLVALEVHRAQPEKALEVLERFRARTLLDRGDLHQHAGEAFLLPVVKDDPAAWATAPEEPVGPWTEPVQPRRTTLRFGTTGSQR